MTPPDQPPLNLLQRVDLELARRITAEVSTQADDLAKGRGTLDLPIVPVDDWVSGVLGLRGLVVRPDEVDAILNGGSCRFDPEHHEFRLIQGMARLHERIVEEDRGKQLEGWTVVEYFKLFTAGVARFRNNSLRRDLPWDAILFVDYPTAEKVPGCLDAFHIDNHFTDLGITFDQLHPVRQAFRVLWLFARIAPFPDFNLSMAWIAMNRFLIESGYPMLAPQRQDRERLHRMVGGPVPRKIVAFESRLLEQLQSVV